MKYRKILTNENVLLERQEVLIPPPHVAKLVCNKPNSGYLLALKHDGFCQKEVVKTRLYEFKKALEALNIERGILTPVIRSYCEYIVPMIGNEYTTFIHVDYLYTENIEEKLLTTTDIEGLWSYGQVACVSLADINFSTFGIFHGGSEEQEVKGVVDFLIGNKEFNRQGLTAKAKFTDDLLKDIRHARKSLKKITPALEIVSRFVYPLVGDEYPCESLIYSDEPYDAFGYGFCRDLGYLNGCGFYCNAEGDFYTDEDGNNHGGDRYGEEFTSNDLEDYLEVIRTGKNLEDPFASCSGLAAFTCDCDNTPADDGWDNPDDDSWDSTDEDAFSIDESCPNEIQKTSVEDYIQAIKDEFDIVGFWDYEVEKELPIEEVHEDFTDIEAGKEIQEEPDTKEK